MRKTESFSISHLIDHGHFGLECEHLRVDNKGRLALTPHPRALGNKQANPEITTDFSESQPELITPVTSSISEMRAHANRLLTVIFNGISDDELLWPLSSPPVPLPPDEQIPIADFGPEGKDKNDYRIYLSKKYGRRKQLYCGVHFNFSFSENLLAGAERRSRFYLNLAAHAMRYRYFLVHLLAASPETIDSVSYRSARLSRHGYRNTEPVYPDFSSPESYIHSLQRAVSDGKIEGPRELYQLVRIKGAGFEDLSSAPNASRIELRVPDLNPLFLPGINPQDLYLMHLYLLWCARQEPSPFTEADQRQADALADEASLLHASDSFTHKMNERFHVLRLFLQKNKLPDAYGEALNAAETRWRDVRLSYPAQISAQTAADPLIALKWANQMKNAYLHPAPHPQVK
ncbi:glutathione synthase [Sporolactobacillus sp. CPB3-1]|uniref:Glutamate--cysteine ligase n=1 Tax=Sporolactobacillus mangiferae TaxID=2940498 RepID=A0ABT0M8U0_9BACL|nr:glutathione synthase [Sporolactobacillus mangiferae]MCL1631296.1 glutathione synthase [Sporolactobacillus mangiferae]